MAKVTTVSEDGGDDMRNLPEPPNLRFLRILVTVLTAVMIAGLLAVVATFVTRLRAPVLVSPDALDMPAGTDIHAITQTPIRWLVTTTEDNLLIFGPDGALLRTIDLSAE